MDLLLEKEWKVLYRLTFKGESGMKERLGGDYGVPSNTYIVMAYDTDAGKVIGWSFAERLIDKRASVGVFVSCRYRRRGIGSKLIKKVTVYANAEVAHCCPHDRQAEAFFKTFGARTYYKGDRWWSGEAAFRVK